MAVVTNFVRYKYRDAPIQPKLNNPVEDSDIIVLKKVKNDDDHQDDYMEHRLEPPAMDPSFTQNRRIEGHAESNERDIRTKQYPTIRQKAEITKQWLKKQRIEAKRQAKQAEFQRVWQEKLDNASKEANEAKDGEEGGKHTSAEAMSSHDTVDEAEDDEDGDEDEQLLDEDAKKLRALERENYMNKILELQEQRLLKQRNTRPYHIPKNYRFHRRKLAIDLYFGFGRRSKTYTDTLSWIIIGNADVAADKIYLLKNNITHILNVSTEVQNFYPESFMYCRIPVTDTERSDIGMYFQKGIDFIKNVQEKRGRILVHCTAGVSRAPTMAMAFIITNRPHVPLVDIYNYLLARRPIINVNRYFLFQLAQLELTLNQGSSCLFHKAWRFYDFNLLRNEGVNTRYGIGLWKTAMYLFSPEGIRGEDDLLI